MQHTSGLNIVEDHFHRRVTGINGITAQAAQNCSICFEQSALPASDDRHDICHKHHKQRLCKIISARVKFYFVNVFLEHGCVSFWFLVIFSHVNQWQSVKWANKYKILILNSHFRLRKLRLSYQGTKNVAIYALSSGKILDVIKIAGVKNMTNIMSGFAVLIMMS